jgi:hypothetical protein
MNIPPVEQRFWAKVDKNGPNGCWEWTASTNQDGYGTFKTPKGSTGRGKAYRFSWELVNGPIPDGMTIDHLCKNVKCVNPDHLRIVTQSENSKGSWLITYYRERAHCHNGHELSPDNVIYANNRRTCKQCKAMWQSETNVRQLEKRMNEREIARKAAGKPKHFDKMAHRCKNAKLTWDQVDAIRAKHANGQSQYSLVREYHVGGGTIFAIVHFRTWKPEARFDPLSA